ncbi:ABC transporter ATP-binding protein [Sulfurovum sp. zt1-1]|uniref:ABC transporter ATP-binding protein n=1 Tax=Sulfurovum zhangzhouensis TaxID=3019067 RepID=A0ABT7QZE5_9BACT|nr:ABC transporter ATP-binding protein [Sulfurovum zhangzhouensis]MDM5271899.1 ABC transporter ATP-binding protein [Sulfurovum zhangzhouensis]
MDKPLLEIIDLHVSVANKEIIKGMDLQVNKGEVHVIFGPNGSGKSTLLNAIMHLPGYSIDDGEIRVKSQNIQEMSTDQIANLGIGMSFQHPPKIKGVTLRNFLGTINRSEDLEAEIRALSMDAFMERELNVGFSGGELKRAEILKLYAQSPDLLLIDEPESGVDIENIAIISKSINKILQEDRPMKMRERSAIIITHTGHILNYVQADIGHVFMDGRIVCTGNPQMIMDDIKKLGFSGCVACVKEQKDQL